jgi:dolichol-phosphate mannosyltransferase
VVQGRSADPQKPGRFSQRKLITLLVPARNEQANLPRVYDEVSAVFAGLPYDYEVLLLDNASTDDTPRLAREFCRQDQRWRYLRSSRDFSVEGSLAAGLRMARGDAAVVLFSDLQDPPERIPDLLARWEAGNDVVYGVLEAREHEPFWKSWGAKFVYRFLGKFASHTIPPNATDFRLLSRRAIDALNQCPERFRYFRGLSHWIGFRSCALSYTRRPRLAGTSQASLAVMFHLAGNALTGFSLAPLRACLATGLTITAFTFALGCLTVLAQAAGWSFGIGLTQFLLLIQLAAILGCTGILGEYVGRTYWETQQRPLYIIEETCNIPIENVSPERSGKSQLALLETFAAHAETRQRTGIQENCHAA